MYTAHKPVFMVGKNLHNQDLYGLACLLHRLYGWQRLGRCTTMIPSSSLVPAKDPRHMLNEVCIFRHSFCAAARGKHWSTETGTSVDPRKEMARRTATQLVKGKIDCRLWLIKQEMFRRKSYHTSSKNYTMAAG